MLSMMLTRVEELAKLLEEIKSKYHTLLGQWMEAKQVVANLEAGATKIENVVDGIVEGANDEANSQS